MQSLAGVANYRGQTFFNIEMNILKFGEPREFPSFDLGDDLRHAALDIREILC